MRFTKKRKPFHSMEKTLVILKPGTIQRGLIGEIISRFEKKGLVLAGMKMIWLSDEILSEHYSHLAGRLFFQGLKDDMRSTPVVVCCWKGVGAINVVRQMVGSTNGREALPGTIRGDYSSSMQKNIIHASDSLETAKAELKRFFCDTEIFDYDFSLLSNLFSKDELGD